MFTHALCAIRYSAPNRQYLMAMSQHPKSCTNQPTQGSVYHGENIAAEVSRRQFSLVLALATTIHKVQGLTMDQIVSRQSVWHMLLSAQALQHKSECGCCK